MRAVVFAGLLVAAAAQTLGDTAKADEPPVPRAGAPSGAVISRTSGEVVRFVAEPAFRALVLGQDLVGGDLVHTGPAGVVGILFVDRTVMRLHPNTELLVNSVAGASARLTLIGGTLWARTPRGAADLRIATPAASAAIRGTDLALSVTGDGTTELIVYDGAVELANEFGAVVAGAGEAARAVPGRPPVKVEVANRAELPQMLFTLAPADALEPVAGVADDLASGAENPAALALYIEARRLMRRGDYAAAAAAFERAAPALGRERRAAALWLAAFARSETGAPFRAPSMTGAGADAAGRAVAAALSGDLAATATALAAVPGSPAALAAAVEVAIVRDDAEGAARLVERLRLAYPGSVPALAAEAAYRADVLGDPLAAEALLERAAALAPDDPDLWNDLGLVRDALDHPLEAEAAFRRALALAPGHRAAAANLAVLLLDTERVEEAQALAAEILADDPGSYLGLRAAGRAALQAGVPEAREMLLRALAAQPAAAETSLMLAIAAHQAGDAAGAAQELDAAARLDPNDPIVPLARSVIALDQGRADAAIRAAQEAARLFRRQEGGTRALAADRETGSPLADAFASIGLTDWARYVADRSYDPLSAASLFGEAALDRPTIGRDGPSADESTAALIQGLMLEPLGASYRLRYTDLLRRPFFDVEIGATRRFGATEGSEPALQLQAFHRAPAPIAVSAAFGSGDLTGPGETNRAKFDSGSLYLAAQGGARAGGFVTFAYDGDGTEAAEDLGFGLVNRDAADTKSLSAGVGAFYRLSERRYLTVFASAAGLNSEQRLRRFAATGVSLFQVDIDADQDTESRFIALGYRGDDPDGAWFAGAEFTMTDQRTEGTITTTDLLFGGTSTVASSDRDHRSLGRAYLGRRQRLAEGLEAEGLVAFDGGDGNEAFSARAGLAWSPTPSHWLRLAALHEGAPDRTTLAPVAVSGLVPLALPAETVGEVTGVILRWDGTFGGRLHIGVEHQSLRYTDAVFATADPLTDVAVPEATLHATTARADYWLGHGVGLYAGVTHADGRAEGGALDGEMLPETPEWTARIGLGWLSPAQVRASLEGVWTSERFSAPGAEPLDPVFTFDAGLSWEPLDKHVALRLEAQNLLDAEIEQPWGAESLGRRVALTAALRF